MARCLRERKEFNGEEIVVERPDRSRLTVLAYATPFYDEQGRLVGAVNVLVDITDRKQIEQQLSRSEQELADFFDNATLGLHWVGAGGIILRANQAELNLLGYAPNEYIGHHIAEFHADKDVIEDILRRLQAGENLYEYEARMRCKDGSIRHVLINSSVLWEDGCFIHTRCFTRDITEQKRLEHARSQLAAIVESSDDAIIGKDLNGVIQSWNAAAQRLFGYTAEQAVGRHISFLIPAERADEEDHILTRLRAGERIDHFDTVRVRSDGQPIYVSLTISPIRDATGQIVGASKIARDITERKRLEDELKQSTTDLSEADRRKDEFLAMLAHELRNPLAPIRNAVQIMRLTGGAAEAGHSTFEMMDRQISQMVRLVDDLLDVSRISQGKIALKKQRVEVASVVHHAVEAVRPSCENRGHDLTVTLPTKQIYLNADPARLAQVVGNLLHNACKFTDRGGRIRLSVAREGEQAVLRVRDNGVGIAADQLPRIFGMFVQVDTSLERSVSGLGLGLSLVKSLVEMHDGTVEIHSAGIGQGSEFVVRMPIMVEGPKLPPEPLVDETMPKTAHRILVVDDNRDAADSLALLLKLTGNDTNTAYDGLEGVEATKTFRPDVILLDIGLPKLDGYGTCRRIREQACGSNIVIIALTGWGQEDDKRRSQEVGFNSHLVKPVNLDALMKLLAELQPTPG